MSRNNSLGLWAGVGLIVLGLLFMVSQFLNIAVMSFLWPFFIIAFGAAFFVGMAAGGRAMGPLAVPGSVIITVGLILFFQNLFNLWATWSYAWTLIIAAAGVGLIIFGHWSEIPDLRRAGRVVIGTGLAMFLLFGLFFELGAGLLGMRSPGGVFWPIALILAGLYVLFGRSYFNRVSGPIRRSTVDFAVNQPVSAMPDEPWPTGVGMQEPMDPQTAGTDAAGINTLEERRAPTISTGTTGVRRLHFRALGDMTIVQGEREGLDIDAPDAVRERIRTEIHGDTLEIRYEQDWLDWLNPRFWNFSPIRYTLYVRDLEWLKAAGLGNITIPALMTRRFELVHSGTGNVAIPHLSVEELVTSQAGLGDINIEGKANHQDVDLSGTGSYHAGRLDSQAANVRLSGLGSAKVYASETLDAQVSGLGSIEYRGRPRVSQHVSGLGSIRQVN